MPHVAIRGTAVLGTSMLVSFFSSRRPLNVLQKANSLKVFQAILKFNTQCIKIINQNKLTAVRKKMLVLINYKSGLFMLACKQKEISQPSNT